MYQMPCTSIGNRLDCEKKDEADGKGRTIKTRIPVCIKSKNLGWARREPVMCSAHSLQDGK